MIFAAGEIVKSGTEEKSKMSDLSETAHEINKMRANGAFENKPPKDKMTAVGCIGSLLVFVSIPFWSLYYGWLLAWILHNYSGPLGIETFNGMSAVKCWAAILIFSFIGHITGFILIKTEDLKPEKRTVGEIIMSFFGKNISYMIAYTLVFVICHIPLLFM